MAMVLNNSTRRLKIKGVSIGPREMADVNLSGKELSNHLFVRAGYLEVSKGYGGTRKKAADTSGDEGDESKDSE